jgi:3-hydroxyacyl-[acyl-carrier-protein] dehydratase
MLESKEIEQALPHRPPFLMVDGILDIVPNQSVVGYKEVREDEPWFKGHFPGEPLFPGVLIIETMAQIGGFCFWTNNSSRGSNCS